MTVLLQSFFASFIHVTFALPLGIRAQLPSQQTIVVMLSAKKKRAVTPTEINPVHVSPVHPNSHCACHKWPFKGHHVLQTPGAVGCCEHFSAIFCPMEVS